MFQAIFSVSRHPLLILIVGIMVFSEEDRQVTDTECRRTALVSFEHIYPEQSIPVCQRATQNEPNDQQLKTYLCRALLKANRIEEALAQCWPATGDMAGRFSLNGTHALFSLEGEKYQIGKGMSGYEKGFITRSGQEKQQSISPQLENASEQYICDIPKQNLNDLNGESYDPDHQQNAEFLERQALAIQAMAQKPDHPEIAIRLNELADNYQQSGRYAEAERLYPWILAIWALWPGDPREIESLDHLAALYKAEGRYAAAESLFRRGLEIREKMLGLEHLDVAVSLYSLADLYFRMGRSADAEPLYLRALDIAQTAKVPKLLWQTQYSYAVLLQATERSEVALFFGQQAVNTLQGLRGTRQDRDSQRTFINRVAHVYTTVAEWLMAAGQETEAQHVLELLKEDS